MKRILSTASLAPGNIIMADNTNHAVIYGNYTDYIFLQVVGVSHSSVQVRYRHNSAVVLPLDRFALYTADRTDPGPDATVAERRAFADSERFFTCPTCGCVISGAVKAVTPDGRPRCADCAPRFHLCSCGIELDDAAPEGSHSHVYEGGKCLYCNESHARSRVYSYHGWGGSYIWHAEDCEEDKARTERLPFFGVELEFGQPKKKRRFHFSLDSDAEFGSTLYHFEHDGSVRDAYGDELITQPCSLAFHQKHFPWKQVCESLKARGFVSHKLGPHCCGLHVHVSRAAVSPLSAMKIDAFVNRQIDRWSILCRRAPYHYTQASKYKLNKHCSKDAADGVLGRAVHAARYQAVNHTNDATIEFRMARGTLNHKTILGTIELYAALVEWVKTQSVAAICDSSRTGTILSWRSYRKFVTSDPGLYPNAIAMLKHYDAALVAVDLHDAALAGAIPAA